MCHENLLLHAHVSGFIVREDRILRKCRCKEHPMGVCRDCGTRYSKSIILRSIYRKKIQCEIKQWLKNMKVKKLYKTDNLK